ncbi:MAG: 3-deoxy-D-manno-octulosonic acid transferase [Bacteroidales bacterium]|nr:3-deoxy-D-manno-octulosonic acid transferase [Bacteroidales bacterium]
MSYIYNLLIYLYSLTVRLISPFNKQAHAFVHGRKDQFKKISDAIGPYDEIAWFHCASLGEFEQGLPVMEAFRRTFPRHKILLTFFSPSGYEVKKNNAPADYVFYLPMDKARNAKRFIKIVRPRIAIFIKYEYWFNYMNELYANKIPLFYVSAIFRKNQHFFKTWGWWFRSQLQKVSWFLVQNESSAELLDSIKIFHHEVSGDTRFDRVIKVMETSKELSVLESFKGNNKVLMAGSSWAPDEDILRSFMILAPENLKLVVVPHKTDEAHINEIKDKFSRWNTVCYSKADETTIPNAKILIVDVMGILSGLYRYADIAYVGGGFGVGIHNILEPAVFEIPVLFGPNHQRFQEAQDMLQLGGGFSIKNKEQFQSVMERLLAEPESYNKASLASKKYVNSNIGATDKVIWKMKEYIVAG